MLKNKLLFASTDAVGAIGTASFFLISVKAQCMCLRFGI